MKTLNTIQKLFKAGKILSKIAFIFSLIGIIGGFVGILCLYIDNGNLIKIGNITLHGMFINKYDYRIESIIALLCYWIIICFGEVILAKLSYIYFDNELKENTPFSFLVAKQMFNLGILIIIVPIISTVMGNVVEQLILSLNNVEEIKNTTYFFNNEISFALGIMFIFISLLCRYGAEIIEKK